MADFSTSDWESALDDLFPDWEQIKKEKDEQGSLPKYQDMLKNSTPRQKTALASLALFHKKKYVFSPVS